jgi:hypothetical protein
LNDETKVEGYSVKYNELFIRLKDNEEELVIKPEYNSPDNYDWKRPDGDYEILEEDVIEEVINYVYECQNCKKTSEDPAFTECCEGFKVYAVESK